MKIRRFSYAANYRVAEMSSFSLQGRQFLPPFCAANAFASRATHYFGTNTNSPFSTLMSLTLSGSFS